MLVRAWDVDSEVTHSQNGEYDGIAVDGIDLDPSLLQGINNSPPYQPEISFTPNTASSVNDDLIVAIIGPTQADPDNDSVTYHYRWFVDFGQGYFVDDTFAGKSEHTGNTIPSSQTNLGERWRVTITPTDSNDFALSFDGFDSSDVKVSKDVTFSFSFTDAVDRSLLGTAPYNPFIFSTHNRGIEVHLPNKLPTDLADQSQFGTQDGDSSSVIGRYYMTSDNLP